MHPRLPPTLHHQRLLGTALMWLLVGSVSLLATLIPVRTDLLGWTPAFWLVGAPLAVLLVLDPSLPRQLLALCRPRRRAVPGVAWH